MQVILLIVGLVLLFAGSSWFTGAATVGIICLALFVLACIVQVIAFMGVRKLQKSMFNDFNSTTRSRRGF